MREHTLNNNINMADVLNGMIVVLRSVILTIAHRVLETTVIFFINIFTIGLHPNNHAAGPWENWFFSFHLFCGDTADG